MIKLGADKKKAVALAVLLPLAGYLVYSNLLGGSPGAPPVPTAPQRPRAFDLARESAEAVAGSGPRAAPPSAAAPRAASSSRTRGVNTAQEWVPRIGGRRPEDRADPAKTDPTLHIELLAKLQQMPPASTGSRSLFDFSAGPAPPAAPDVKIPLDRTKNGKKGLDAAKGPEPPPPPAAPTGPPPEPPPPAIPLKFYGFAQGYGGKRAFFRLGEEEIFVASEGQLIQGRYRIVRIGLSSAMVEDTQHKNNQQSLRIEEIPKENL